ncbi:hypothetical protein F9C11_11095 [Amycolatopsis sp. VS8301801F10]|uniref:hypothetical protein n=1 Tax=Amycolatopsis sp. VS8301801F10 TaxID=2652442 RepID=UPI0038FBF930
MTGAHFGEPGVGTGQAPNTDVDKTSADLFANIERAPYDAKAAEQVRAGGAHLKALAQNGSFAVNEAGFRAYLHACNFFLDGYGRMFRELGILTQAAKMGSAEYAQAVADFNVKVADGDASSLLPNLDLLRQGIEQAKDALEIARRNYRETEAAHTVSFAELSKESAVQ